MLTRMPKLNKSNIAQVLAISWVVLATTIPVRANQGCADKVMATCTKCHIQTRICEKLGKKSKRDWKVTLKRMLRYGLVLNETDQDNMLKCLLSLEKNSGNLCK